jgi:hypothetical protein
VHFFFSSTLEQLFPIALKKIPFCVASLLYDSMVTYT